MLFLISGLIDIFSNIIVARTLWFGVIIQHTLVAKKLVSLGFYAITIFFFLGWGMDLVLIPRMMKSSTYIEKVKNQTWWPLNL